MALWGIAGALGGLLGAAAAAAGRSFAGGGSSSGGGSSASGSYGSGGGSTSPASNEHLSYLDQTYGGGSDAYIRSQQQRYAEAQKTGNLDLVNRLQADANRVGYMLPGYTPGYSGGAAAGGVAGGGGVPTSGFNISDEAKAYLNQNYAGGYSGYTKSQIDRYIQAVQQGDQDLMGRLQADALRIGYPLPSLETIANILEGRGQPYGQQPQVPPPYMQQPVPQIAPYDPSAILGELQRISQNINAETAPIVNQAYEQMLGTISSIEQSLIQRYTELGQSVDPATQAALASLKQTVEKNKQDLMEEMSRRGLLQSGIWLEMEDRLQQGMLTEQQRLMATRLSDLQNQLNQALMSLDQSRIQATSQFGSEQIRLAEAAAQRRQQALSDLVNAAMQAQQQMLEQQREAQRLAWEREKFYAPWTMGPSPEQMLPYQYPTANTMVPYEYGLTPYQQAQLGFDYTKLAQDEAARQAQLNLGYARLNQEGANRPSQADITRQNLADAQTEIWNMLFPVQAGVGDFRKIESGQPKTAAPVAELESWIWKNAGRYTQAGINPSNLVDYAWMAATGYPKPKQQEEW